MIYELSNFVSEEQLIFINSQLSNHCANLKHLNLKQNSYRDGESLNISLTPELKELDNFLFNIFSSEKLINFISRRYYPQFETGDTGYEFHRYYPGDVCHVHADGEAIFSSKNSQEETFLRFASVVLHLNTPSSGGEIVFPTLNKTIKTEAGKIVIFPSYGFAQHYTNLSLDNRDVIVTWFVYRDLLVRKK